MRTHVRSLAKQGLPIYAECGGLMYLGQSIICEGREHPMAGVLPIATELCGKPQGHGYTCAQVVADNPFHPVGSVFNGHEFHYSKVLSGPNMVMAMKMLRGHGIAGRMDGLIAGNVFATYTHIHALGVPGWAERFVDVARRYRGSLRTDGSQAA
jgi:cobyrinic acid a,c-diamide synthase